MDSDTKSAFKDENQKKDVPGQKTSVKVKYLGDKSDMVAYGFNFLEKNGKTAMVPVDATFKLKNGDKLSVLAKFKGNAEFQCDCEGDYKPPTHYVRQIKTISSRLTGDIGPDGPVYKTKTVRENINVGAFYSKEEALEWIEDQGGTLDKNYYIMKA